MPTSPPFFVEIVETNNLSGSALVMMVVLGQFRMVNDKAHIIFITLKS